MTTWLFTQAEDTNKNVIVESDRWYEARQFAETHFACGHDGIEWTELSTPVIHPMYRIFKLTWSGHAAGKHDNIKMTVTEIKDRP